MIYLIVLVFFVDFEFIVYILKFFVLIVILLRICGFSEVSI